jgi:transglutaminase superfamily protein
MTDDRRRDARGMMARFRALPPEDQRLFLGTLPVVWIARFGLWLAPFRILEGAAARIARSRRGAPEPAPGDAARVGWAVSSAARFAPGATCLTQALAAEALLRRRGHPVEVRLGVAREDDGRFLAHAWVVSHGRVVVGDHDLERYSPLAARER